MTAPEISRAGAMRRIKDSFSTFHRDSLPGLRQLKVGEVFTVHHPEVIVTMEVADCVDDSYIVKIVSVDQPS
ncbi:MAG TPA: hypothetical protein VIJ52_00670 [Pseudolabrys sp.]